MGCIFAGLSENRHWFADRADVVLFEELDGKPLRHAHLSHVFS